MKGITAYSGLFVIIISVLALSYQGGGVSGQGYGSVAASQPAQPVAQKNAPISIDQYVAANAVTSLAETAQLPVAGSLREATTTLYIQKQLAQSDAEVISKPEIVQPTTSAERGITSYTAKEGDTLETIARQFGVSTQTLRWANNTTSDAVAPGKVVTVPRTDGVVYTVKDGDTLASIAAKYKVDAERIVLYNDLDASGALPKDAKIILPSGELPEAERPGYVAPTRSYGGGSSALSRSNNFFKASVGNRYAPGNCTWYSYERRLQLGRPIGSFWGDAKNWATSGRAAGFTVNNTPAPGAIFQTRAGWGGYGHVGIVERVENGRVFVSDMNYGGYNVITHRELENPGSYMYIH